MSKKKFGPKTLSNEDRQKLIAKWAAMLNETSKGSVTIIDRTKQPEPTPTYTPTQLPCPCGQLLFVSPKGQFFDCISCGYSIHVSGYKIPRA